MKKDYLKTISYAIYVIAFTCGLFLFMNRSFGHPLLLKFIFYASGGAALVLSFVNAKMNAEKTEFNVLFWTGALLLFVGLILKTLHMPFFMYAIIAGMLISGFSYFYNPSNPSTKKDNDLLDN